MLIPPSPFFGGVPSGDSIRFYAWFLRDEGQPAHRPFWPVPVTERIAASFEDTGLLSVGIREYEFNVTLPEPVLIEAGKQMWLALVEEESTSSRFFWFEAAGVGDSYYSSSTLGDPWTWVGTDNDVNFTLYGMPDSDGDGVADAEDLCPDTNLPEAVPTSGRLLPNHFALTGEGPGQTFTAGGPGQTRETFTIFDTRGCSCDQIIDWLGLSDSHRLRGCSTGIMRTFIGALPDSGN
jgi:hypothetical protein